MEGLKMFDSLRHILTMIRLEMLRIKHDRTELYVRAVQPILWLIVYGPIMGAVRAIPTGSISYTAFITPGILIQSTTFVSIFYGLTIVWERENGVLKKLLVSPMKKYTIVVGRALASGIRSLFQMLIIVPIALLIGVQFYWNFGYFLLAIAIVFFSSGGFAAISIIAASFFKTRERFMGIGQAITFPLFFLSSALYPIDIMPPVLKSIAMYNPMSYIVDALRGLLITGSIPNIWLDLGVLILFDVIMFAIGTVSFKKIIQ
jgi:ABC-2 type transport system permease protein